MENLTGIIENNKTQMRRGVLEYSILLILACGDEYASSIIQKMKDVNIIVAEGTIYPLLIRLKKLGLLNYRWEESTQGPPRKYYRITEQGKIRYKYLLNEWKSFNDKVKQILRSGEND